MNNTSIKPILADFAAKVKPLVGNKLDAVILFGSYARDDFEEGSDVDVMVLVNMPPEQLLSLRKPILDIAFDLGWDNGFLISTVIESAEIFNRYKEASGFFSNVAAEGVRISV